MPLVCSNTGIAQAIKAVGIHGHPGPDICTARIVWPSASCGRGMSPIRDAGGVAILLLLYTMCSGVSCHSS